MGIQSNFNMDALRKYAYSKRDEWVEGTLEACKSACIKMVDRSKQTNTYQDQTNKLRSSIGCVLYHNGVEVFNYFASTGNDAGVQQGLAYARSVAEDAGNHLFVAVIVAGAEYARYVEAKGYDVLTGSSHRFSGDFKTELENIKKGFVEHVSEKFVL